MTDLELAEMAAEQAAMVVRDQFGAGTPAEFKGEVDPVTAVDRAAEALVRRLLAEHRPGDAIVGEEEGGDAAQGRTWILDPLDGTVNFVHGLPHVAVSIALYDGEIGLVGVVADVVHDELFVAERGAGASVNGSPLSVSSVSEISRALVAIGFPYDRRQEAAAYGSTVVRILERAQGMRRMGSAALDLAYVAAGRVDGYVEHSLQPWDVGAGAVLIAEAGGRLTTTLNAKRPVMSTGPVIASNGHIHDELLGVM